MEEVVPFDLARMVFGDAPWAFLGEIVVRTLIIYGYTLLLLRWIGGRSIAQLSVVEFLLVIALGSAVGDAMFYPEVPLFHAMVVITVVVLIDKVIDLLNRRYNQAKAVIGGSPIAVMSEGRILTDGLINRGIGALELMEKLRLEGVANLGEVRAAYLEASGQVSVFRYDPPRPGLPILPPHEVAVLPELTAGEVPCCINCGAITPADARGDAPCPHCKTLGRTGARLADEGDRSDG
ncbi:MAG: DUF421 domain-containing protein [Cereibacter sphaeroides]|uniref:DUF421 domain-containing protein n=1 Tax=Cereibacter sphaeroides TaxID=1063 RepID=A0A2W5SIU7_CERSP|nr:MAG: DUF421 domain-containing protein [Cereibacter sphaeroides]